MRLIPTILLAAGLAACSQTGSMASESARTAAAMPSVHPESGLRLIPVRVAGAKGTTTFRTELADTPAAQERGLMFRTSLAPDAAMLFPSGAPEPRTFWMKNTVIPLDLVFVGPDHRILNIAAKATPYSLDPIPSDGPALAVLEIAGGRAAELGLKPGDRVDW